MDSVPDTAFDRLKDDLVNPLVDNVKHICVIGAGPSGLAALKIIADTAEYKAGLWKPIAYEKREQIGGIWFPASPTDDPPLTPQYDSLTTNLPHPIMAYPSFPFPPATPLYPRASTVQTYLEDYASHFNLIQHIRLNTTVTYVDWDAGTSTWRVQLDNGEILQYHLLIVANGHYTFPRYPDTPGLTTWRAQGKATHSAWYRCPDPFGQTILVIGAGPSGRDVAADMRRTNRTVIHSITGGAHEDREDGGLKQRCHVAEYLDPVEGRVRFEDGSVETGIDHCILATGYQYRFPFFSPSVLKHALPLVPPLPSEFHNSTYHLFPLARHLFPLVDTFPPHVISFLGLPMRIAPLPLVEAQARATLALFADPSRLNKTQEAVAIMEQYEKLREKTDGDEVAIANAWHKFEPGEQFDYRDALHEFVGGEYATEKWKVPLWTRQLYEYASVRLRVEWEDLERTGEAEEWLKDVGERAKDGDWSDWVELMWKVLKRAEDRGKDSLQYKMRL